MDPKNVQSLSQKCPRGGVHNAYAFLGLIIKLCSQLCSRLVTNNVLCACYWTECLFEIDMIRGPFRENLVQSKVVPEGWAVTVSRLTLAVIFSITPFLQQSSSVCYAHSQMQKRSMVYLFWTMGYSDQAVRNKTFNSN